MGLLIYMTFGLFGAAFLMLSSLRLLRMVVIRVRGGGDRPMDYAFVTTNLVLGIFCTGLAGSLA